MQESRPEEPLTIDESTISGIYRGALSRRYMRAQFSSQTEEFLPPPLSSKAFSRLHPTVKFNNENRSIRQ
jgi:hypothetical protein